MFVPCHAFLFLRAKKKIDEIQKKKKNDMTKVMLEIISRQSDNIDLKINRTKNLQQGICEKHVWPIINTLSSIILLLMVQEWI